MKAKKKEVKQMALADLGLSAAAAQTELIQLEKVPDRSGAKIIPGPAREAVTELVRILKNDEKVI
jgi:electron transfer flavoprotein beta subunit